MARIANVFPSQLLRKAFALVESVRPRILETIQPVAVVRDLERDHAKTIWNEFSVQVDILHNPVGDLRPVITFHIEPEVAVIARFKRFRIFGAAGIVYDIGCSPFASTVPIDTLSLPAATGAANWQTQANGPATDSQVVHRGGPLAEIGTQAWLTRVLPSDDAPVIPFEYTLVPGTAFLFQVETTLVDFHATFEWEETRLTDIELPRVPLLGAQ